MTSDDKTDSTTLDALEAKVSELWGPSQFDWVLGRTTSDDGQERWFYYCGRGWHPHHEHGFWAVGGYADTISAALQAMIDAYPGDGYAYNVAPAFRARHEAGKI